MPPKLSIVIATHNAAAVISQALTVLFARTSADSTEVILADSSTDETATLVGKFPQVRLLHFEEPLPIHVLRGRGIAIARGAVIAILDPFSFVAEGWERALLEAHRCNPAPVIGGAVDFAGTSRPLAWAAAFNEYGLFMPPVKAGATALLPGCNVSYKREALFDADRPRFPVFWKTFVNSDIQSRGALLWLEPDMLVTLSKPVPFAQFLTSRFDHGRCFAGMRSKSWSPAQRLLYAAGSPLLPLILCWRWSRGFWSKGTKRALFVATLPAQLLLFGMWALGEAAGYLFGSGRSCQRLFS